MFVGSYWSQRKETREQAAERIARFFEAISGRADGSLTNWFLRARKKTTARIPAGRSAVDIAAHLRVNRQDTNGDVIPELGFSLGVWNGAEAGFSATIGAYAPRVNNVAVLSLDEVPQGMGQAEWGELLRVAIAAFDPDNAVVTSNAHLSRTGAARPWEAGWLTYQRGDRVQVHDFAQRTE